MRVTGWGLTCPATELLGQKCVKAGNISNDPSKKGAKDACMGLFRHDIQQHKNNTHHRIPQLGQNLFFTAKPGKDKTAEQTHS